MIATADKDATTAMTELRPMKVPLLSDRGKKSSIAGDDFYEDFLARYSARTHARAGTDTSWTAQTPNEQEEGVWSTNGRIRIQHMNPYRQQLCCGWYYGGGVRGEHYPYCEVPQRNLEGGTNETL